MLKMVPLCLFALLLAQIFSGSLQASTPESKTYWAAVVEFSSEAVNQTSAERVEKAVTAYVEIIEATVQSDIIVFPESTLNSIHQAFIVPDPTDNISPCDDETGNFWLRRISCSARQAKKYVVINITEKKVNLVDEEEEILHYNANIVFDRNGVLISRYRKFNLFGEAGINVTETPDISYFTTDFNVTFGHFICFDLLFKAPAMKLMENAQITDIVYPTMWFSELPFLTAVQAQNMWAMKQGVNFLAAGASNPKVGSTGSGIYSKDGPITAVMSGTPLRRAFVAEVTKKQFWHELRTKVQQPQPDVEDTKPEDIRMKRDKLEVYTAKHLNLKQTPKVQENLCYEELCCEFEIQVSHRAVSGERRSYQHFVVAFDGVRSYDGFATGGTIACALITCLNETLASCGLRFDAEDEIEQDLTFEAIRISGRFRSTDDVLLLPNTVDHKLMPLPHNSYKFEEGKDEGSRKMIKLSLIQPSDDIYTFGIYGRDFAKDGMEPSTGSRLLFNSFVTLVVTVWGLNFIIL